MSASSWVHLEDCTIKRMTGSAFLIEYDGEEFWIPKSQIDDPDRLDTYDTGVTVSITEWIAKQKGIEVTS